MYLKNISKSIGQRSLVTLLVLILSVNLYAQKALKGTVVDEADMPLIGATVAVEGTSGGTITDIDGNFSIKVKKGAVIKFSYVGYKDRKMTYHGQNNVTVKLEPDAKVIDEVVVVGYSSMKKTDLTGSIASVAAEDLQGFKSSSVAGALAGQVAGVQVIQSDGAPGSSFNINIRGVRSINAAQSPLYVVDGMIIQNGGIENINPSDIESIDILKDASATAIYGSRGANGVILVTTKKGKEGKISLNYSGTVTFETLHDVTQMMSASEWLDYARLAKYNMGSYPSATPDYAADQAAFGSVAASWANIEKAWTGGTYDPSKVGSYDWASNGKQTGITHEHTLSASGGTDKFQGYASFGYLNQKGTQPGQAYERYTLKTSFDANPISFFKMGTSINASYSTQDYGYSFTKSVTGAGDLYGALRGMLPWTVTYDEDGK